MNKRTLFWVTIVIGGIISILCSDQSVHAEDTSAGPDMGFYVMIDEIFGYNIYRTIQSGDGETKRLMGATDGSLSFWVESIALEERAVGNHRPRGTYYIVALTLMNRGSFPIVIDINDWALGLGLLGDGLSMYTPDLDLHYSYRSLVPSLGAWMFATPMEPTLRLQPGHSEQVSVIFDVASSRIDGERFPTLMNVSGNDVLSVWALRHERPEWFTWESKSEYVKSQK